MEGMTTYNHYLTTQCDPENIVNLSIKVFKEGHLELLDDLILSILPLANIVYHKNIQYLDDRCYAKEDLISDAILRLYQDMKLRWDKYIYVDSYYYYFSTLLRNGMIGLVHSYHNYYSQDEYNPDDIRNIDLELDEYDKVDTKIIKESLNIDIYNTAQRILQCRTKSTNLLLKILSCKYKEHLGVSSLKSRVRVFGIPVSLFNFYCDHVDYAYKLSYNYHYAMLGGREKMVSRISGILDRFEDTTYRILATKYYDSIIPEMYAELGTDTTKKFIKVFSGKTVTIPDYNDFCDNLLGGAVLSLTKGNKENLYKLADEYHIPYRILARIYNKVSVFNNE